MVNSNRCLVGQRHSGYGRTGEFGALHASLTYPRRAGGVYTPPPLAFSEVEKKMENDVAQRRQIWHTCPDILCAHSVQVLTPGPVTQVTF